MFNLLKAIFNLRPSLLFFGNEAICTNGNCDSRTKFTSLEFCLPFAQTVNRPVCSKQLVHASAVRMSRYRALSKFGEHS